ncbi:MAG: response regulator transcription factor [Chloroflexota bacterium]
METRVFIVDDTASVRAALQTLIAEIEGVELVGYADEADTALRAIADLQPDLVILDIRLRRGHGIDVLEQIKKSDAAPQVIVLTSFPFPQYRERCLAAGADYFFDKSNEFDRITGVLSRKASPPDRSSTS